MTPKYLIVIEKTPNNLSAFSPDLPGCVATGATKSEVEDRMREAIRMHIDGMREDGLEIPEPSSVAEYIEVPSRINLPANNGGNLSPQQHLFPSLLNPFGVGYAHR